MRAATAQALGERAVLGVHRHYLARHGFPIRYRYVKESWPLRYYQTVYATETGSAEMPSAGRAFTPELITRLIARGVQFPAILTCFVLNAMMAGFVWAHNRKFRGIRLLLAGVGCAAAVLVGYGALAAAILVAGCSLL